SICTFDPTSGRRSLFSDFGDGNGPALGGPFTPQPLGIAIVPSGSATTTTLDASPVSPAYGQTITLTARVTGGAATPTGQVAFVGGGATLATVTLVGGEASTATAALAAGSHTIRAEYTSDAGRDTSNATATIVVNQASSAVTLASSANPAAVGQRVTL